MAVAGLWGRMNSGDWRRACMTGHVCLCEQTSGVLEPESSDDVACGIESDCLEKAASVDNRTAGSAQAGRSDYKGVADTGGPAAHRFCPRETAMCGDLAGSEQVSTRGKRGGGLARLVESEGAQAWVVLSAPELPVRLNGTELLLGLSILRDRDEIMLEAAGGSKRFYFSAERQAAAEPAPPDLPCVCARCKTSITEGSLAVRCPACGAWHHQRDDRPCWTYAERCGGCQQQKTALTGQLQWSPADL